MKYCNPMVTQYIEVLQSYGNPNTLKCFNILKCFNLMKVTIGLQHFNILGYHRIAILQYIANYLFLQRTLTDTADELNRDAKSAFPWARLSCWIEASSTPRERYRGGKNERSNIRSLAVERTVERSNRRTDGRSESLINRWTLQCHFWIPDQNNTITTRFHAFR